MKTVYNYLSELETKANDGEINPGAREYVERVEYASAYDRGECALKLYRNKEIEREIGRKYSEGAQIAILYNKDSDPDEYAAYQIFRAECKAKVDLHIAELHAELMEFLGGKKQ